MSYGPSGGSYYVDLLANVGFVKTERLEATSVQYVQCLGAILESISQF